MHRHVVCLVALDQILRLFLRRTNRVGLELHSGRDLFLDPSLHVAGFRVPLNVIANFEFVFHLRESGKSLRTRLNASHHKLLSLLKAMLVYPGSWPMVG